MGFHATWSDWTKFSINQLGVITYACGESPTLEEDLEEPETYDEFNFTEEVITEEPSSEIGMFTVIAFFVVVFILVICFFFCIARFCCPGHDKIRQENYADESGVQFQRRHDEHRDQI